LSILVSVNQSSVLRRRRPALWDLGFSGVSARRQKDGKLRASRANCLTDIWVSKMERHQTVSSERYILCGLCSGCTCVLMGMRAFKARRWRGKGVEMERKRHPRHPEKRAAETVKDLAELLSELRQLRAKVQKAEAGRRLRGLPALLSGFDSEIVDPLPRPRLVR
jgi:hypothetical protein